MIQPLVSIIVPTYQEAENLSELVRRISKAMESARVHNYEIVLVDDNSQDGTKEIIETLQRQEHSIRWIVRTDERGLSSAVLRGFREAKGEVLVCMDADLSHPPEKIPELMGAIQDPSFDFALGTRYAKGGSTSAKWGFFRWLNSRVATLLARPFTSVSDPMSGFFAISRKTLESAAPLNPLGYKIALELMVKCHCRRIKEIPIHFEERRYGRSKLNLREQIRYLIHLRRLMSFKLRSGHSH